MGVLVVPSQRLVGNQFELRFAGLPGQFEHQLAQRLDRYLLRCSDVDDLPVCGGGFERTRDAYDEVGDVDEAPRLPTSAMQLDRLVMCDRVEKDTLRPSPPVEVLPLTVGPEEPEGNDGYSVILLIGERKMLVRQLRDGVRPPPLVLGPRTRSLSSRNGRSGFFP